MIEQNHYNLRHHNTFGITAYCHRFVEYSDVEQLRALLPQLKASGCEWLHIGGGSNLLFTRDYPGTILHSAITGIEVCPSDDDQVLVTAGAGLVWDNFVEWTLRQGYYGLENLSLIPGEVGASAVQNIGAYGVEAADRIAYIHTIDTTDGQKRCFAAEDFHYAYRHSLLKEPEHCGRYIVTHVTYSLALHYTPVLTYAGLRNQLSERHIDVATLTATVLRDIIVEIRRVKLPDPQVVGSAGSFFMNPIVSTEQWIDLQRVFPDMPHYPAHDGVKLSAGWMIDQCGWRGRALGKAGVYDRQALVLVNLGGATGSDVVQLSDTIQRDVHEKFGVLLHPEVIFI